VDGRSAGRPGSWLRQHWLLPPYVGRRSRPLLHPLKTVRQIALFAFVCLGLDALGAYTLPWAWVSMIGDVLSLLVAFVVVEVAYRRWWQPANQSPPA
jgi:4-hydroxybenzoate polyprenyltransferase